MIPVRQNKGALRQKSRVDGLKILALTRTPHPNRSTMHDLALTFP